MKTLIIELRGISPSYQGIIDPVVIRRATPEEEVKIWKALCTMVDLGVIRNFTVKPFEEE